MENMKIFHADDKETQRDLVYRILRRDFPAYDLESFDDGVFLAERMEKGLSDVALIITDNQMPFLTGSQIIRDYALRIEIPMILAYGGDKEIGEQAVRNGAFGYILKPFSVKNFSDLTRRALES